MASGVSVKDFENWLTPKAVEDILRPHFGNLQTIRHALLERLKAGMVLGIAGQAVLNFGQKQIPMYGIPNTHWEYFSTSSDFWTTGAFTYQHRSDRLYESTTVRLFDVRFGPKVVREMVPPTTATPSPAPEVETPQTVDSRKPVSSANLRDWYELYQRIYPDELNTEPHAVQSARGMFHDKAVSRDAVRKIRGSHKPGPKGPRK